MKNRIMRMRMRMFLTAFMLSPPCALAAEEKPLAPGKGPRWLSKKLNHHPVSLSNTSILLPVKIS